MAKGRLLGPVARDLAPILLGALVGLGGGVGAVGFKLLLDFAHFTAWQRPGDFPALTAGLPAWLILLVPTIGGLSVGLLTHAAAREARGHGVPEVISAVVRHRGLIRPRVVLVKALASAMCIGSGGSCGREGPIAQIGAAWGSAVAQWLPRPGVRMRVLVGAGAAAGISATFNAPIAGVVFALEVVLRDFRFRNMMPIIVAGVTAVAVSHTLIPGHTVFSIPAYQVNTALELFGFAALGLGAGVVGVLFTRMLYATEDVADRIPLPVWLRAAVGGLGIGLLALVVPQIMGVGYATVSATLDPANATRLSAAGLEQTTLLLLVGLLAAKMLATSLTLGFGGSGGVFAPSLFLGATYGCAFGYAIHAVFPHAGFEGPGAYAMVGMASVVAATTHAPLCSMLILFEMTNDYDMILPLMLSSVLATLMAQRILPESIYTMKMVRRGERVQFGADLSVLEQIPVSEVADPSPPRLAEATPLVTILARIQASRHNDLPVVGPGGEFTGMVCFRDIKPVMQEARLHAVVIAADLARRDVVPLRPTDTLDVALMRFSNDDVDVLPVTDGPDGRRLDGVLSRADLMARYQAELGMRQEEA